jgi:chlorite dismutase
MNLILLIVLAFITFIFFNYSSQFSFAKTLHEKEQTNEELKKNIFNLSINKNDTSSNDNLRESNIQNNNSTNTLNDGYPDQYYVCRYPKQLITDYSFLEKLNCG